MAKLLGNRAIAKEKRMIGGKRNRQSNSALVVTAFMTGFWLLGIGGLMLGSGLSTDDGGTA